MKMQIEVGGKHIHRERVRKIDKQTDRKIEKGDWTSYMFVRKLCIHTYICTHTRTCVYLSICISIEREKVRETDKLKERQKLKKKLTKV